MINIRVLFNKVLQNVCMFFILIYMFLPILSADMKITITGGINTALPIAIIPFTSSNHSVLDNSMDNIDLIIATDLRNSGKFSTLPMTYLPHNPTKLSEVIPIFWKKLGVNTLVLGSINVNQENNNYIISYQLIDSSNNPPLVILENQFSVQKQWLRYIAHTISNEIFEKLIGIQGVFCTKIAYVLHHIHHTQYPYELCISDYDGYDQISIYRSKEPLMSPAWSPDGKQIAYVTFASKRSELIIRTLHNGNISKVINFPQHNGSPAFSPDGKKIAFSLSKTGSLNLYVMDLISGEISQLTDNRYNNTEPSWFPDNRSLAYTSDQGGNPQVYKIDIYNPNDVKRLSWLIGSNYHPKISMDGTFLVMVNRYRLKQSISTLNLLNDQAKIITTDSFLPDTPSIAPNGTMLLYSSISNSKSVKSEINNHICSNSILELISIDGRFKARLKGSSETEIIRFPVWSSAVGCCLQDKVM